MNARVMLLVCGMGLTHLCIADRGAAQEPLKASAVSAGDIHTCALATDGRAYCWGANQVGALGNVGEPGCAPSARECTRPVLVSTDVRFISISAGFEHTCALAVDSLVWCWGRNVMGELGVPPAAGEQCGKLGACARVPALVSTDLKFREVVSGQFGTCAIDAGGRAYCWGYQNLGMRQGDTTRTMCAVGDPTQYFPCVHKPMLVDSMATFLSLDLQRGNACGLTSEGQAFCWGLDYGPNAITLEAVKGKARYVDISVGGRLRGCLLLNSGGVTCWGAWPVAQDLMVASEGNFTVAESGFITLSAGMLHACGLNEKGRAYCWGTNADGELGTGSGVLDLLGPPGPSGSPVRVAGGHTFRTLSARGSHTCAVAESGTVMCWGKNQSGQIGDGSTTNRNRPTPIAAPIEAGKP